ncbi:Uncharacterized protein APZ42_034144 [Daphnia magna]|uniref:SWIM-type domain-containing protein n=1 Tax=Daphnia magna TaxID=35525 RepID=A0A164KHI3_9CRUS|nr:Uncharacterized protein APZ42_034144 [Daphnia magna]
MAKEFQYSRWLNIAVREIFTEIEKCCSNKKEGDNGRFTSQSSHIISSAIGYGTGSDRPPKRVSADESFRKIYSCLGSLGTPYLIPYTGFTCTCPSYRHNLNSENLWCPHLLAVQLSIAMDIVQQKQVTEDVMKTLLSELVMFDD